MNRKIINYIVKSKKVYVGLEDSKRTWKLSVRCEGVEIHYTSFEAKYAVLREYLKNKYPDCEIAVIYEAGFKGFGLYDKLTADKIKCVVTPPNKVTQEKSSRIKTDKIDARRLAAVLEKNDYKECAIPDPERREDRQLSRLLVQVQNEIIRAKNRIRKFFDFIGYSEVYAAGAWSEKNYTAARSVQLSDSLKATLDGYFEMLDNFKALRKKLL
ncbi:MAG TPA: transposase [Chitinispirillaceae bacterium]|nr:transposase [Chitinispirillaceae bacterium]